MSSSSNDAKNRGLATLFNGLVLLTRLSGGRGKRSAAEMRGFRGSINYDFGISGCWHMNVQDGLVFFHRECDPNALATVEMTTKDFFELLTGKSSYLVAQMAGKIRIKGDGHAAIMVGTLVADLQEGRKQPGVRGWLLRWWTDLAARHSGTGVRFQGR